MTFSCLLAFILLVFWRPQEWLVPVIYGWPILDLVVGASSLALLLEWDQGRISMDSRRPQYFLFVGLFFAACMSHIANTYFVGLMDHWMIAFRICFFGILLFSSLTSTRHLRWVCRIFVLMGCFMVLHAVFQQTRGYGFGGQRPVMSWRPGVIGAVPRSKFFGIFEDPNDMGQLLATAMPLSFVLFQRRSFRSFLFAAGICYWLWIGLESTISRGSLIAVIVAAGVILIHMLPNRKVLPMLGIATVAGLALLPLSGRFMEGSAMERVDFWGEANWVFKTRPLFGVGLGMLREYLGKSRAVHNAFVLCYTELGVFGYFFWFNLILVAVLGLIRTRVLLYGVKDPEAVWLYRFSCWGLAALGGFCASSYFLSRAFVFPLFFLLAMLGVVPFLAQTLVGDDGPPLVSLKKDVLKLGLPLSLASIAYIYVSILLLNAAR